MPYAIRRWNAAIGKADFCETPSCPVCVYINVYMCNEGKVAYVGLIELSMRVMLQEDKCFVLGEGPQIH